MQESPPRVGIFVSVGRGRVRALLRGAWRVRQICREQIWSPQGARRAEHRMCSDNPSLSARYKTPHKINLDYFMLIFSGISVRTWP